MNLLNKIISSFRNEIGAKDTLTRKTFEGGFWTIAASLANKGFGLIRTIVLARLLSPNDFGLFGIALAVIAGLNIFSETGVNTMLIQKRDATDQHWNVGWVIGIIRGLLIFTVLWVISGIIANFYEQPYLVIILHVLSFSFLLQGFSNIGLVNLQKTMRFKKKVAIDQLSELWGNLIAIILGVIYQNVWALVIGKLVTSACFFICSYLFLTYKPKIYFDIKILKEFFTFGQSLFIVSVLVYIITTVDDLFVGKVVGITALGYYTMGYNIANLPTINISRAVAQVTLPAYSQIQQDIVRVEKAFLKVFAHNAMLCVPISVGLMVIATELIEIILGGKWMPMLTTFRILCLLGLFRGIASIIGPLILGCGHPDYLRNIKIFEFILFAPLVYPSAKYGGIVGVSTLTTAIYFFSLIMHTFYAGKILPSLLPKLIRIIGLLISSTLGMALILLIEKTLFFPNSTITGLIVLVLSAIIFYVPLSVFFLTRFLRSLSSNKTT